MADLKWLYEQLGFENVLTYIQSGNVIFDSPISQITEIKINIEKTIKEKYQFEVPVEIRTGNQMLNIINVCPFQNIDLEKEGSKVLVSFLSSKPSPAKIDDIKKYAVDPEELVVKGTEVYIYCPNGYGTSKLTTNLIEKKLDVVATTRNWKTVLKLDALSN